LLQNDIPFEVRTTVHSDLISQKELQLMINYLEQKKYKGNYYIQHFKNNIPTLVKLRHSFQDYKEISLSTQNIKIQIRD
jgi:pyruvate formate lyase activating enzyme